MKKPMRAAASLIIVGMIAGCGSGSMSSMMSSTNSTNSTRSTLTGKVADGYLVNATVFLDKNGNYQLDPGEPSTLTDQNGSYSLNVAAEDVGKYPIVALAIKDTTIDLDNGQTVPNSYLLSLPAKSVVGTVSSFVSPMSTLIREKMEANPGMTLTEAMTELRNQMNLPAGMNMMADYVSLGSASASDPDTKAKYQFMHAAAQNMAALMAGQATPVIASAGGVPAIDVNRFRSMMGAINAQLPQMVAAMPGGMQQDQNMMNQIAANISVQVSATAPAVAGRPFRNKSSLFPPMMGVRFWNMTGHPIRVSGMMGGMKGSGAGGMGM